MIPKIALPVTCGELNSANNPSNHRSLFSNCVYLVNSPFQVLCAYEHLRDGKNARNIMIFHVQSGGPSSVNQTQETLNYFRLSHSNILPSGRTKLARFSSIVKKTRHIARSLREKDTLVIGNLGYDIFADAVNCAPATRTVCLDDGLKTVLLWSQSSIQGGDIFSLQSLVKSFLFNFTQPDFKLIEYFSIFHGHEPSWAFVKKNRLDGIRARISSSRNREIVLVGQPVFENLLARYREARGALIEHINLIKARFPGAKVKYYAHRNTQLDGIPSLAGEVDEVVCPKLPIEVYLLEKEVQPVALIGLFSTALFSIPQIFRVEPPSVSFFLPDLLGSEVGHSTVSLYRSFAGEFFEGHPSDIFFIGRSQRKLPHIADRS